MCTRMKIRVESLGVRAEGRAVLHIIAKKLSQAKRTKPNHEVTGISRAQPSKTRHTINRRKIMVLTAPPLILYFGLFYCKQ